MKLCIYIRYNDIGSDRTTHIILYYIITDKYECTVLSYNSVINCARCTNK